MDCICDKFVMVEDGEVFDMSQAAKGDPGPGVAPGGTTGQLLAKASDTDYDTEWIDAPDMDAGGVTYDPTEAYDDGTVGKELTTINSALSSLQSVTEIIDTASGAIASFPDGSGLPMRSLVAEINPVQDLHGQSSPWPAGGGKNLFDVDSLISGGINGQGGDAANSGWRRTPYMYMKAGTYTISRASADWWKMFKYSEQSTSSIIGQVFNNNTRLTETFTLDTDCYCRFGFDYIPTTADAVQLEAGSTATAWTPYSNLCPISGHTGLSVEVRGGNLLDKTGAVRGGFDASGNVLVNSGDSRCVTVFLEVKPNVTYYIDQTVPLTQGRAGFWYDANQTAISQISFNGAGSSSGAVTSPANAKYCRLGYLATNEDVCTMTVGSSALTPYEPYNAGTTTTVTFPDSAGTVYGGSDEVVGGELTSTMYRYKFTGAESQYIQQSGRIAVKALQGDIPLAATGSRYSLCDTFHVETSGQYVYVTTGMTVDELKAYFSSLDVYVVYTLATPQTYQLTPQQVSTLLGQNNVWHDANGDTTVTYQASIKGYIDKVLGS